MDQSIRNIDAIIGLLAHTRIHQHTMCVDVENKLVDRTAEQVGMLWDFVTVRAVPVKTHAKRKTHTIVHTRQQEELCVGPVLVIFNVCMRASFCFILPVFKKSLEN